MLREKQTHCEERMHQNWEAAHNYTNPIRKYYQDSVELCDCWSKNYNEGLFTVSRNDKWLRSGTFTDQIIEQTLMQSGKTQGELINITQRCSLYEMVIVITHYYTETIRDLTGTNEGTWAE